MTGLTMGTEAWIWMAAWALVMILVVWLLVREPSQAARDEPSEILRARFAKGEITEEAFKQATAALGSTPPVAQAGGDPSPGHPARPRAGGPR